MKIKRRCWEVYS